MREFYKRSSKNGEGHLRVYQCRSCCKKGNRQRQDLNREEIRKKGREYGAKMRTLVKDETFLAYGGYLCVCCGETEKSFLTLDHVNNDGADFRRRISNGKPHTGGGHQTYYWLRRHGFPSGHQVLCFNCQWGKRMNNGLCPHQARRNDYPSGE